jgi:hypothetical protein
LTALKEAEMTDEVLPIGVDAQTGRPLSGIDDATVARLAGERLPKEELQAGEKRADPALSSFGVKNEADPRKLAEAGWGVIFAAGEDSGPLKEALAPLLARRKEDAGELFKVFEGAQGVQPGESAEAWLARHRVGLDIVDPELGVPYYLLIVASAEAIPMSFQYTLDIFWAVGRIHFDRKEDYAAYAQGVVDYERAAQPPQRRKRALLFATEHPFDPATTMLARDVARPFIEGSATVKPLGKRQRFQVDSVIGDDATKARLTQILAADDEANPVPALLFSGTHGMAFNAEDARQSDCQGALVCQDWEGFGSISEKHWFSAADLPSRARLAGMIHFLFACYGGGWEKFDTFRDGPGGQARQIAQSPRLAKLPTGMLARGALAVLAHVDRAWAYSFKTSAGHTQSTGMREVLASLMQGFRIGHATDQFNVKWAALAVPLADALRDFDRTKTADRELARRWIARDDARNYMILGDPAVRLRVEDMIDGA